MIANHDSEFVIKIVNQLCERKSSSGLCEFFTSLE